MTRDLSPPLDCELCKGGAVSGTTGRQLHPAAGHVETRWYSVFVAERADAFPRSSPPLPRPPGPAYTQAWELEGYMCLVDHALAQCEVGVGQVGEGL